MDWAQVMTLIVSILGIMLIVLQVTISMNVAVREDVKAIHEEVKDFHCAMRDVHGRVCTIEERNRKKE